MKITSLTGREILDSRGMPTIECNVLLENGTSVHASVPSGKSSSKYAAFQLRDCDNSRYDGFGVFKAVELINTTIASVFIGKQLDSKEADRILLELDGTNDKSKLGGNTLLAVSIALLRAHAAALNVPPFELISHMTGQRPRIPRGMFNLINGGVHANSGLSFQEFMVVPFLDSFEQELGCAIKIHHEVKRLCKKMGYGTQIGDEGGCAPSINGDGIEVERRALDLLVEAIESAGFESGKNVRISLDVAASTFYDERNQKYALGAMTLSADELIELYHEVVTEYTILSLEDPLVQNDWAGWQRLMNKVGQDVVVVGDDIFATNPERIEQGAREHVANASIIKPNQIGTVAETLQALAVCREAGFATVVSHRSGETNDSFIADLAVGAGPSYLKAGAPEPRERMAKYERLVEIEELFLTHSKRVKRI